MASYKILKGTSVEITNVHTNESPTRHVMQETLEFAAPHRISFGGHILYFRQGDWEISVGAQAIQEGTERLPDRT